MFFLTLDRILMGILNTHMHISYQLTRGCCLFMFIPRTPPKHVGCYTDLSDMCIGRTFEYSCSYPMSELKKTLIPCKATGMLKWTYLSNTGIYLLHTSQKPVLDQMARPDWYESSKKYPIPVAASYGKKRKI